MSEEKNNTASVYVDGPILLALNRICEEVRLRNQGTEAQGYAPSIGHIARNLLRKSLGLSDTQAAQQEDPMMDKPTNRLTGKVG